MPSGDRVGQAAPSPPAPPIVTPAAKNANTGTATPADSGRKRCSKCSASPGPGLRRAADHRDGEPEQHPGDGGVHPGRVHQHPGRRGQRQQQPPRPDPPLHQHREQASGTSASASGSRLQGAGVEDRDDRDREQVVDHGEGEQERAQRGRQVGADHGQHGQRERDVGGGRDRPARPARRRSAPALNSDVDQRRDDHAADRGGDRQRGPPRVAQVTGDELAFELQPGDEEEDRQQPVGGPLGQRQVQVQRRRADRQRRSAPS